MPPRITITTEQLDEFYKNAIKDQGNAETAILYLMSKYDFNLNELKNRNLEFQLPVNFSRVEYRKVATYVGLDPKLKGSDIPTFTLQRARLPNHVIKSIAKDMHVVSQQYGLPSEHSNEEARSRFLAPIFNQITALFRMQVINTPESIIPGRIATKGRVEYHFSVYGGLNILVIEIRLKLGSGDERRDMVAQVMAEAAACDYANVRVSQGFKSAPIFCILCDGSTFEFFIFDSSQKPSFSLGVTQQPTNQRVAPLHGYSVASIESLGAKGFIVSLRPICESIFHFFLRGWKQGLEAVQSRQSEGQSTIQDSEASSWASAIGFADSAIQAAVNAAIKGSQRDFKTAESDAENALSDLIQSINALPSVYQRPSDTLDWWDEEIVTAA